MTEVHTVTADPSLMWICLLLIFAACAAGAPR